MGPFGSKPRLIAEIIEDGTAGQFTIKVTSKFPVSTPQGFSVGETSRRKDWYIYVFARQVGRGRKEEIESGLRAWLKNQAVTVQPIKLRKGTKVVVQTVADIRVHNAEPREDHSSEQII